MPTLSVRIDGRSSALSGDNKALRLTTASRRRAVTGQYNTKSSSVQQKSTMDRLAAPTTMEPRKPELKASTLLTTLKPLSRRTTIIANSKKRNQKTGRRPASNDKENKVIVTDTGASPKNSESIKRSPRSTAFRTPQQLSVSRPSTATTASTKKVTFGQATKLPGSSSLGNEINSLRRSIRETITPPSRNSRQSKLLTCECHSTQSEYFPEHQVNPPKHVEDKESPPVVETTTSTPMALQVPGPPKTPSSILRDQLEMTMDESLLISPSSENLNSCLQSDDLADRKVDAQSFENTIEPNFLAYSSLHTKLPQKSTRIASEKSKRVVLNLKRSVFSGNRENFRSTMKSSQTTVRHASSEGQGATKEYDEAYNNLFLVQNVAKTLPVVQDGDMPTSQRGNGVCLDLTALFMDEQKTVRKCNRKDSHLLTGPKGSRSALETSNLVPSDERQAELQCETLSKWLNFTLDPLEEIHNLNQPFDEGDSKVVEDRDRGALRTLMLHQYITKARYASSNLFQSYEMKKIRDAIDSELDKGRLAIRGDRDMYSDLVHRQKITKLLFAYSTPWLRLGLETMFGETILPDIPSKISPIKRSLKDSSKNPTHQVKIAIRSFIVCRVISDAAVLAKYTKGRCTVPSGNFEKKYRAEIRTLVLRRLLVLIFFLDRAKQANLLDKATCLFARAGSVKSTRDVLISLCRDFLASEGDITKHLGRIGLGVSYKQEPFEEIDMTITNFAVDLRDGIRLTKIAELLTHAVPNNLLKSLRIPAVSRLQKLHNVGVALGALRSAGVGIPADVSPHHIVDAHRSMVMKAMWALVSHYAEIAILNFDRVEEEIQNVQNKLEHQRTSDAARAVLNVEDDYTTMEERGKAMLLRWCRAVCALFGLRIADLTLSFADGKALCYLVHYYHPRMLSLKEIRPTSRDLATNKTLSLDHARHNEKLNSSLAHIRLLELGGIPGMMPATDTTMVPHEKSMSVYLCYAFSRLVESRQEVLAIERIQREYRAYYRHRLQAKQSRAALIILQAWHAHKVQYFHNQGRTFAGSVAKIEKFVWSRRHILRRLEAERLKKELTEFAIVRAQSQVRMFLSKKNARKLRYQQRIAIVLQLAFRQRQANRFVEELWEATAAATLCQSIWRGYAIRKQTLAIFSSIILVQAIARSHSSRRRFLAQCQASACIQRIWRGFSAQMQFHIDLLDIIAVQSFTRRRLAINHLVFSIRAVITMQVVVRGYFARCIFQRKLRAAAALKQRCVSAIEVQRLIRGFLASRKKALLRLPIVAATMIQREWHAKEVRILVLVQKLAAVRLQGFFRAAKASLKFQTKRSAAINIQSAWKRYWNDRRLLSALRLQSQTRLQLARKELENRRTSVFVLQGTARCWLAKRAVLRQSHLVNCVVLIQAIVRRYFAQKYRRCHKHRATMVQSLWRAHQQWRFFHNTQLWSLSCQALWRGKQARYRVGEMHASAIVIQAVYRRHRSVQHLESLSLVVVKLQAWWRAAHHTNKHQSIVNGIAKVEALIRRYLSRKTHHRNSTLRMALQVSVNSSHNSFHAALRIETFWRASYQLRFFRKKRVLVVVIAAVARGKFVRLRQNALRQYAIRIQSAFRRHAASQILQMCLEATIKLQSAWRTSRDFSSYKRIKGVTRRLQRLVRASILQRVANKMLFLEARKRSLVNYYIGISGSASRASIMIQSFWRFHIAKQLYGKVRARTIRLQSSTRRLLANNRYERIKQGIHCIQRHFRGSLLNKEFNAIRRGVILVQACWRYGLVQRRKHHLVQTAVIVQRMWRRYTLFHAYQRMVAAIMLLQSHVRRKSLQKQSSLQGKAVARLQNCARSWLAKKKLSVLRKQKEILLLHSSARFIQQTWRVFTSVIEYRMDRSDIVIVQTIVRKWLSERQVEKRLAAIVHLQSVIRMLCAKQEAITKWTKQQEILCRRMSLTILQRVFRGILARDKISKYKSARSIQKIWRAYSVHVEYLIAILGAIMIQAQIRRVLGKTNFSRQKYSAIQIQRFYRGFASCFQYEVKLFSILRIQQAVRAFYAQKVLLERTALVEAKRLRLMMSEAALAIQINVRNFLARRTFQRLIHQITVFQGLARGFSVRRRRKKRILTTAARLKEANLRALKSPNMRLGARTLTALIVLQTSRSLAEIMTALQTLELSTRFSTACCEAFAHTKATEILLSTIKQCNRSRPHVQLLIYIVRTLRNVGQHSTLLTYIATVPSCEVLLDLVQSFRDKPDIFPVAILLVERCIVFDHDVEFMCKTAENGKRLKGVYNLCKRKSNSSNYGGGYSQCLQQNTTTHWPFENPCMHDGMAAFARIIARLELNP